MDSVVFSFEGKRALVTGAGRGIGRAVAKALCKSGATTYALSKTQENLTSLKAECPQIQTVCIDLTDWDSTQTAVEAIGPVDLLVNNAGVCIAQSFLEVDRKTLDETLNVNVRAAIAVSQVVAKGLIARNSPGSIVNISSIGSMKVVETFTSYCASKGALDQLTRIMALELGPYKIRVNSVNPTIVMTDMAKKAWTDPVKLEGMLSKIPLGKFAEEEDVVNAVLFLLSDKAAMVNGTFLMVDGGYVVH